MPAQGKMPECSYLRGGRVLGRKRFPSQMRSGLEVTIRNEGKSRVRRINKCCRGSQKREVRDPIRRGGVACCPITSCTASTRLGTDNTHLVHNFRYLEEPYRATYSNKKA